MIVEIIAGTIALGVTASGWFAAYRSRGESRAALAKANEEAERARIADAGKEAADRRADDADAKRAAAVVELKETRATTAALQSQLDAARRENRDLYERLAKAGVPVGPVLVDSALDRLYADKDRREAHDRREADSRARRDSENLPGESPAAANATDPKR